MKYIKICVVFCAIVSCFAIKLKAQDVPQVNITSVVYDDKGNPVSGVLVSGNEGKTVAYTDNAGKFSITVAANSVVVLTAKGFKMQTLRATAIPASISLAVENGSQEEVYLPFRKIQKHYSKN
mgnify:CR=1 FL=1